MSSIFSKLMRRPVEQSPAHIAEKAPANVSKVEDKASKVEAKASKPVETDDLEHPSSLESKEVVNSATKDKAAMEAAKKKEAAMKAKEEGTELKGTMQIPRKPVAEKAKAEGSEPEAEGETKAPPEKKSHKMTMLAVAGLAATPFLAMAANGKKSSDGDSSKSSSGDGTSAPTPTPTPTPPTNPNSNSQ